MNMAVDELLLAQAGPLLAGVPLVRVYGWAGPAVSIGYAQRLTAVLPAPGVTVVRRPTGGGMVWHDVDLTYTVVVPAGHPLAALERLASYRVFHRAVIRLLAGCGICGRLVEAAPPAPDRATMRCFVSPTIYDVLWDGGKAAGAAQRRTRDGLLHQGSILLAPTGLARSGLAERLRTALAEELAVSWSGFEPPPTFLEAAADLAASKYAAESWTQLHR